MSSKRKYSENDSSESDGEGKERNRKEIKERERQWQTVGSSDEEKGSSDSSESEASDSSSSSESHRHERSKHDKKESKHKKKKDKKERKESKKHKKEKDHKKDKKKHKKHHSDKDKKPSSSSSRSVNQNEYGKYGIIREENYFHKQREFEAYMAEVKGIPGVLSEGKREIMQHFKGFMEDYNTATMPHEKYYNYERWEMQEYQRKRHEDMRRAMADDDSNVPTSFNDEEIRRKELKKQKEEAEQREFLALKNKMAVNKDIQGDMRRQAQLSTELQLAFKRGDTATVKRLERLLAPEEAKTVVKHPWA